MINIPSASPESIALPGAPMPSPAEFAANRVGQIGSFLGGIAAPLLQLGLMGLGIQMIVTGKKPKILGGN
jgi:hypothetical protein